MKENKRLAQEKDALNARLTNLRQINRKQEKKIEQGNANKKQDKLLQESEKRIQHHEAWAMELEEKLAFTVDKFEEQNKRFLECGRDLAELQDQFEEQKE